MKQFVIYEVWTRSRVVQAASEDAAFSANEPIPIEGLHLCNWHAQEVATPPKGNESSAPVSSGDDEKYAFDNGSGMTELMTAQEMIAEIQRLGRRCEALTSPQPPQAPEVARLIKAAADFECSVPDLCPGYPPEKRCRGCVIVALRIALAASEARAVSSHEWGERWKEQSQTNLDRAAALQAENELVAEALRRELRHDFSVVRSTL